jgi:hypothetical protein
MTTFVEEPRILEKTKKEDVMDFVKSVKKDFEKLNLFEMLGNLDINNISDSLKNVKSHLKETMGETFNPDDFDNHMKHYMDLGEAAVKDVFKETQVTVTPKEEPVVKKEEPVVEKEEQVVEKEEPADI